MKRLCTIVFLTVFILSHPAEAQKPSRILPAEEVLSKAAAVFLPVRDFSAAVEVEIRMDRVQIPKMKAVMYFKKPEKVHFSSQSFLMLPREGLALNPSILQDRYRPRSIAHDTLGGKKVFKLFLIAKEPNTRLRELNIWVDPLHWTIEKVETIPYEGRILSLEFSYEFVQGQYWLPAKLVIHYSAESERSPIDSARISDQAMDAPQRAIPRSGAMTILYSGYKVNAGITDEIFEQKEKQ